MDTQATIISAVTRGRIASRLWAAARTEFAVRGYHGARVQGIAKRAGCNVALLYRHWASKRALYVEILKSIWVEGAQEISRHVEVHGGVAGIVDAYLDLRLKDPEASQIAVRELLDGGPFLKEIAAGDPAVVAPYRQLAEIARQGNGHGLRAGVDPEMAVLLVAGFAALIGAANASTQAFFPDGTPPVEAWKATVADVLLHGLQAH